MPSGVYKRTDYHRKINSEAKKRFFENGGIVWNKGRRMTPKQKEKMSMPPIFTGDKSSNWKGGISFDPKYRTKRSSLWRKKNRERYLAIKRKYNFKRRKMGDVSLDVLQDIYEDNIKCFGTLTCVYCIKKIKFGEDTVDHIIPLKKNGNHNKDNLVISCRSCNSIKKDRLYEEVI